MAWNVMCWRNLIWNRKSGRGISCSPAPFCKIANSICVNFNILSRIQMCPIRLVVSAHMICSVLSCLWTAADCATWQTSFDPIESSLTLPESFPILHRENTNSVNKWPISARASASIYSAGGQGASDSREHLIGWEAEVRGDVIKIVDPYWRKRKTKFWMFISSKCEFCHCLEHISLQITLRLTYSY